ncbi:hypothetical protein D3C85_1296360 [compost metagenome]
MANASCSFGCQQVTARCFEELQDSLVFPQWRVRHVDDDLGAIHRLGQPLAGDAVHARLGGGCEHVMAALAEVLHKFRANEAGASDDDDLHGVLSAFSTATIAVDVGGECLRASGKSLCHP